MKRIYILHSTMWNGTVPMITRSDAFTTRELAEETVEKLREINKSEDCDVFPTSYTIDECDLFESREDVPCLNPEYE